MEAEIEDIKKLDAIIKEEHDHNNLEDEFDDFINNTLSDEEEQQERFDTEELSDIDDAVDSIFHTSDDSLYHNVDKLKFGEDLNLVKNFLDLEEIKEINTCKDPKLKELLILNRAKHVQLQNIRYRLFELLKECKLSLKALEGKMNMFTDHEGIIKTCIPRLGCPYYKTKSYYSCNPNADIIRKRKSKELCVDYLPQLSRWTTEDQVILKRAIVFNYNSERLDKMENKLKLLTKRKNNCKSIQNKEVIEKDLEEIEMKITEYKDNENDIPAINDSEIDWVQISKIDLNNRHPPKSCKAFWNIYLHPSINKSKWSNEEDIQIEQLAKHYNLQNWDQIAKELNNNRSGFSVCVHYYTTFCERFRKSKFHPEEDQYLIDVVEACRIGNYIPWSKVVNFFDHRSRAQLYNRYKYHLEYSNLKKGSFTIAEDVLIATLVHKFGKDFSRCAKYIPNRSSIQICHRYQNYLRFDEISLGTWLIEEDEILMEHVRLNGARDWSKLFQVIKTKNRSHFRQRYVFLRQWLLKHEGKTLMDLPRKNRVINDSSQRILEIVKKHAEYFNSVQEIPTIEEINAKLCITENLPKPKTAQIRVKNDNIDIELIEFFQSRCKIRTSKAICKSELNHITEVVTVLLTVLDAELEIPSPAILNTIPELDRLDFEILANLFQDACKQNTGTFTVNLKSEESIPSCSSSPFSALVTAPNIENISKTVIRYNDGSNKLSYIPPNINTLVAMRSMLVMCQSFKSAKEVRKRRHFLNSKPSSIELDHEIQNLISNEQEKYIYRLSTLFKWPAIMSIIEPNDNLISNNVAKKKHNWYDSKPIQKSGRPKKCLAKIDLMNIVRKNNYLNRKNLQIKQIRKGNIADMSTSETPVVVNNETKSKNTDQEKTKSKVTKLKLTRIKKPDFHKASNLQEAHSSVDLIDIKPTNIVKLKSEKQPTEGGVCEDNWEQMKRKIISETATSCIVKKIKIEPESETNQLREDIDKLDSILMSELNDRY